MLHESQYGDATRKPTRSALTGKPLADGDGAVYFKLNGYTVGVRAVEWRAVPQELRAAAKAEWTAALPTEAPQTQAIAVVDYDSMSFKELKALAEQRRIDVSGRRSTEDLIQALRYADLQGAFAEVEASGEALDLESAVGE